MLKFLFGVILVQAGTTALYYSAVQTGLENSQLLLTIGLLELVFSILAAFWFSTLARQQYREELEAARDEHAREREKIRVNAERQKARIVNKSQKQLLKETRRAQAAANFKIGATFAAALAFGGIMLYSQFVTFGLLILSTAGGALAGYLARGRQLSRTGQKKLAAGGQKKALK